MRLIRQGYGQSFAPLVVELTVRMYYFYKIFYSNYFLNSQVHIVLAEMSVSKQTEKYDRASNTLIASKISPRH
jgi:hypothetical protein